MPLATGDELIKFWKVKVKGQSRWGRYALHWTRFSIYTVISLRCRGNWRRRAEANRRRSSTFERQDVAARIFRWTSLILTRLVALDLPVLLVLDNPAMSGCCCSGWHKPPIVQWTVLPAVFRLRSIASDVRQYRARLQSDWPGWTHFVQRLRHGR